MHYVSYQRRKFIRWLLLSLLCLLLAACSTTSAPQIETEREFSHVASVTIDASTTEAELEAMYGGATVVFKPEAGFAVLGFYEDEAAMTTLSTEPNQDTFISPAVQAAGVDAWAGGVDAWAGGVDAWAGGVDAWAGGVDAWAGGVTSSQTYKNNKAAWDAINLEVGQKLAPNLGAGVTVAVIDTGVGINHPAMQSRLAPSTTWKDFVDNDSYPDDGGKGAIVGHGTAAAGLILQVAPEVKIMPIRVLGPNGIGDTDDIISAIDWAVQEGADIINMSLGTFVGSEVFHLMVEYAANKGVLLVNSAGNEGQHGLTFPAQWATNASRGGAYILSVGSVMTGNSKIKSPFSNYGGALEILAPGERLVSVVPSSTGSSVAAVTGTSFAAPVVSGALALAVGQDLNHYPRSDFQNAVKSTAKSIDWNNPLYSGKLGSGRLDVAAFLNTVGQ